MATSDKAVLTAEEQLEAERIADVMRGLSEVVIGEMSRLLASRKNNQLFGETEFVLRDAILRIGAQGIEAALEERKKRGTKGRA